MDGGNARVILSALVMPVSITDNAPMLDLLDWVRIRSGLKPNLAVGDAQYGTVPPPPRTGGPLQAAPAAW